MAYPSSQSFSVMIKNRRCLWLFQRQFIVLRRVDYRADHFLIRRAVIGRLKITTHRIHGIETLVWLCFRSQIHDLLIVIGLCPIKVWMRGLLVNSDVILNVDRAVYTVLDSLRGHIALNRSRWNETLGTAHHHVLEKLVLNHRCGLPTTPSWLEKESLGRIDGQSKPMIMWEIK